MHSYGVGVTFVIVVAIVDGNGCAGVRRNLDCTCLGERTNVIDSTR
jgi:hypothetical protein